MTLRAADLCFVLPHAPRTAVVLPGVAGHDALLEGLRSAGVEVRAPGRGPVDLVVAGRSDAEAAQQVDARSLLWLGRMPRAAAAPRGLSATRLLVSGGPLRPSTVVPLRPAAPLAHHLGAMAAPRGRWAAVRNRLAATTQRPPLASRLPADRIVPPSRTATVWTPASETGLVPRTVAAARDLGVTPTTAWLLGLGRGDDLQRAVFLVLDEGLPRWAVKFGRVPGAADSFDRDEAGLAVAARAGGVVLAHAPRLLGRLEVDGRPASVETAAIGRPLLDLLPTTPWPLLDRVVDWIAATGSATASDSGALRPELDRLAGTVLPGWLGKGVPESLVAGLPAVPGVVQHNDLGCWNIISDGSDFTVVDWESARGVGLPLWDLVYFAGDALARIDGPASPEALLRRCVDVFAGRSPHSPVLFAWLRTAVRRLEIPPAAVGPLVTLCWLHHARSADAREIALRGAQAAPLGHLARMAGPWLADAALGPRWSRWQA